MSSFLRRLFSRSKIDVAHRPTDVVLPAAPDPDDLFDWSPRAKRRESRPEPGNGPSEEPAPRRRARSGASITPISDALSQFRVPPADEGSRRPERGAAGPPSIPFSPPPPPPAQIRLLMTDGTVVEVAGDPEFESRIRYLAESLFAPTAPPAEPHSTGPGLPEDAFQTTGPGSPLDAHSGVTGAPPAPDGAAGPPDPSDDTTGVGVLEAAVPTTPQMRLVFSDGSEAALAPEQAGVDRLSYVIANLMARPTA